MASSRELQRRSGSEIVTRPEPESTRSTSRPGFGHAVTTHATSRGSLANSLVLRPPNAARGRTTALVSENDHDEWSIVGSAEKVEQGSYT